MADFNTLMNSEKPLLVDFYAEWCGPCKTMAPLLKKIKEQFGEELTIIKVDIDKNEEAATFYHVRSVPTLILFRAGKILWKNSGLMDEKSLIQKLGELITRSL